MRKINTVVLAFVSLAVLLTPVTATATRMMPLRIVEPLACMPGSSGCEPLIPSYQLLREIVDRTNSIYAPAGIKFWLKSVEYYYIPKIVSRDPNDSITLTWSQFKSHTSSNLEDTIFNVFPNMPQNAYDDTKDSKTLYDWLNSVTAFWGDPDEVLVWILSGGYQSQGQFPWAGRTAFVTASNCYNAPAGQPQAYFATSHLAHELGHFSGLLHPNDGYLPLNPKTNTQMTYADDWEFLYCQSPLHFFTSRSDFVAHPCSNSNLLFTYNAMVESSNPFEPPYADILNVDYGIGETVMKGLLESTGQPDNPPESFDFAYDVMGYYSVAGLDLRVPAFFNSTQLQWLSLFTNYNMAYEGASRTSKLTYSGQIPKGASASYLNSLRLKIGTADEDFIWWSNGDWTFARETMPIAFKNYTPVSADFDNDGKDDIIWYDPTNGKTNFWWGRADRTFDKSPTTVLPSGCQIIAGRFKGKSHGAAFMLYKQGANNTHIYWYNGNRTFTSTTYSISGYYKPFAVDFDGDGNTDIFWYNPGSGTVNIWWSNGDGTFTHADHVSTGLINYTPIVGNFNGNAGQDIFWYRPGTGPANADYISWSKQGSRQFVKVVAPTDVTGTYTPLAGDFNGDGKWDIYWKDQGHSTDYIWEGSSTGTFTSIAESAYGTFVPVAGDFDGDGKTDIFWYRGPY
ncbi:MAG TPA: VCBS repeat-containing protein [Syntrophobacteraceae bacterium]|nr:VCBS repeat-containing protein [Syntrophobacteraceae bacterium]